MDAVGNEMLHTDGYLTTSHCEASLNHYADINIKRNVQIVSSIFVALMLIHSVFVLIVFIVIFPILVWTFSFIWSRLK